MPSMCVIVCPWVGPKCPHGIFRMNGECKPSQLCTRSHPRHAHPSSWHLPLHGTPWLADSHWQNMHKGNPAAEQLVTRWRVAMKNKSISLADLNVCAPCQMTGDKAAGYEPLREPPSPAAGSTIHFPHTFAFGSAEYHEWLLATDTL